MLGCEKRDSFGFRFLFFSESKEIRIFAKNLVMSTFSRLFWVLLPLLLPQLLFSQDKKDFGFRFYGQVRADFLYVS